MKRLLPLLIVSILSVSAAQAQTVLYSTDFTGTNGSTPANWTSVTGALAIYENDYRLAAGSTGNALAVYNGTGASSLEDYTVSANFRIGAPANGTYAALIANYQNGANFYQGRLFSSGTSGTYTLQIYKTVSGVATLVASSATFSYTTGATWNLSFTVADGQLSLYLYDTSGSIVTSATGQDSTFTSGTAGVRATPSSTGAVVYEDFAISTIAIPEPAGVAIGIGALGLVVAFAFRRRQAA